MPIFNDSNWLLALLNNNAGVAEKRRLRERSNATGSDDDQASSDALETEFADPISDALQQIAQSFAEAVSAQILCVLRQESGEDKEPSAVEAITPDTVCEASDALNGLQSLCHSFYSHFGNLEHSALVPAVF